MKYSLLAVFAVSLGSLIAAQSKHTRVQPRAEREYENLDAQREWSFRQLRDPRTGEIPRGIEGRSLDFARTLPQRNGLSLKGTSHLFANDWRSVGPTNAGGRTQAIGIDIKDESHILAAAAQGGVWSSNDSGYTWKRCTAPDQLKDITTLVQDRRAGHEQTWYCGTGELLSTTNRRIQLVGPPRWRTTDIGNGMYKSSDNGLTWHAMPSTVDNTINTLDSVFDGIWQILVDYRQTTQNVLYVACYGAIMRSVDGGVSWTRVLGDPIHKSFCTDIAMGATGVLYAYLSQETHGQGTPNQMGIFRSTDGIHWTNITPANFPTASVRMRIDIAPSNNNVVYVCGETPNINPTGHGLFKYDYFSGDGSGKGGAWTDLSGNLPYSTSTNITFNTLGGYALVLRVSPQDTNIVYLGGTNLYRSMNGFASSNLTQWIGGYNPNPNGPQSYPNHHPDQHCLEFSPSHPNSMFNGNDGGIFHTYDNLNSLVWSNRNNGYVVSIGYVVSLDHATPQDSTLNVGLQDQGSWIGYSGNRFRQYYGGDGCYSAIANHRQAFFCSSQFAYLGKLILDANLGNVSTINDFFSNPTVTPQFVAPWVLDPADNNRMYAAADNTLWMNFDLSSVSSNQTSNWTDLTGCDLPAGEAISAFGTCPATAHRLYFGSSDGHVYRVQNTYAPNPIATNISSSLFPPHAFVSSVAVDPQNSDSIVVSFSNYHVQSLFASSNGGQTWRDVSGNLEQNADGSGDGPSARWVSIVYRDGMRLFLVGTSTGLYSTTSLDNSVVWYQEGVQTIGRCLVENIDVRQSDGFVAIATQGSGLFTTTVGEFLAGIPQTSARSPLSIMITPNPAAKYIHLEASAISRGAIGIYSEAGVLVQNVFDGNLDGPRTFDVDCHTWPQGVYFVKFTSDQAIETRRLVVRR